MPGGGPWHAPIIPRAPVLPDRAPAPAPDPGPGGLPILLIVAGVLLGLLAALWGYW